MARSVSVASGAEHVAYSAIPAPGFWCDECGEHFPTKGERPALAGDDEFDADLDADSQQDVGCCPHCKAHHDHVRTEDPSDDWDYYLDDFKREMRKAFPSLHADDRWLGREDHALLANDYCYIGASEYCGLVSMWVVPKEIDDYSAEERSRIGRRDVWIKRIEDKFRKVAGSCFGQALIKQGTFSNGEGIFQPANGKQQGGMGLGFSSKEGWL